MAHAKGTRRKAGLSKPARKKPTPAPTARYRGYVLDLGKLKGTKRNPVMQAFESQIDLMHDIPMGSAVFACFRREKMGIDVCLEQTGRATPAGIFLPGKPMPHMLPILLHEMLHQYHERHLKDGRFNRAVMRYFQQARDGQDYERGSYMLSNVAEFFAMTASAVLYGRIARAPYTRRKVRESQPGYYAWLVREFGLRPARAR